MTKPTRLMLASSLALAALLTVTSADVEPLYGMICRTAMMSSTNVSGPMRKVMRRSSFASATDGFSHVPPVIPSVARDLVAGWRAAHPSRSLATLGMTRRRRGSLR